MIARNGKRHRYEQSEYRSEDAIIQGEPKLTSLIPTCVSFMGT